MNLNKTNPCEYPIYWTLMSWTETDCLCCSVTRAALMFLIIGISAGMALTGHIASAVTFLLIAGAAGVGLLYAAAIFWKDEPGDKPDGESK